MSFFIRFILYMFSYFFLLFVNFILLKSFYIVHFPPITYIFILQLYILLKSYTTMSNIWPQVFLKNSHFI